MSDNKDRACPCLYLDEPCMKGCTCKNQFSSSGCLNCCTYGSLEQRKAMAEYLDSTRTELAINKIRKSIKPS